MSSRDLVTLVFRILGVLHGLRTVSIILGWFMLATEPSVRWASHMPQQTSMIMGFVVGIVGTYLLLFQARRLACFVVPEAEHVDLGHADMKHVDGPSVFRLLLRVTGAFAVAWAIPELAGHGMLRVMVYEFRHQDVWRVVIPGLVKLGIGIYFLRGGDLVVRLAFPEPTAQERLP